MTDPIDNAPTQTSDIPEPLLSVLRQAVAERATDVHLDPPAAAPRGRARRAG